MHPSKKKILATSMVMLGTLLNALGWVDLGRSFQSAPSSHHYKAMWMEEIGTGQQWAIVDVIRPTDRIVGVACSGLDPLPFLSASDGYYCRPGLKLPPGLSFVIENRGQVA